MSILRFGQAALVCLAISPLAPFVVHARAAEVRIDGALVSLIEQTEVPARDAGVLLKITADEGAVVEQGQLLGQIEDDDARIQLDAAEAEATIADTTAKNDVKIRFAKKQSEVADAELRRAEESIERFNRSISQTELDKLKLEAQRCVLAVEEAEHELTIAKQTLALKRTEVAAAQQVVARRKILAPLAGVVVQTHRRPGEWVKPGDAVLRIMRIDRLRVEGFMPAEATAGEWKGRRVKLVVAHGDATCEYPGAVSFVSPEIDPVNGQIRLWAEIENHDRNLRPGQRGTLVIGDAPAPPAAPLP